MKIYFLAASVAVAGLVSFGVSQPAQALTATVAVDDTLTVPTSSTGFQAPDFGTGPRYRRWASSEITLVHARATARRGRGLHLTNVAHTRLWKPTALRDTIHRDLALRSACSGALPTLTTV